MVENTNTSENTPLVSVLMIAYNQEAYISEAIESVLQQKCNFYFEIVIGEDCSTDSTMRILAEYEQKYTSKIRIINSESNIGMIPNFLRTINACKGKYIAICEGDDYWTDSYKLQKQVDFLETNHEYALIATDISCIDENGERIDDSKMLLLQREMRKSVIDVFDLLECNTVNTVTTCIRSYIIKRLAERIVSENLWYAYDYWFWLQIAIDYKIKLIFEKTAAYRIHNQGLSRQKGYLQRRTPYVVYNTFISITNMERHLNKCEKTILATTLFRIFRNKVIGLREKKHLIRVLLRYPDLILHYVIKLLLAY